MSDDANLNSASQLTGGQSGVALNVLSSDRSAPLWQRALGWVWFLNCLVMALFGTAPINALAALFYVASGAMALPPLWRRLRDAGVMWSGRRRAAVGFGAIVMAFFASAPSRPMPSTNAEEPVALVHPVAEPSKPKCLIRKFFKFDSTLRFYV